MADDSFTWRSVQASGARELECARKAVHGLLHGRDGVGGAAATLELLDVALDAVAGAALREDGAVAVEDASA